MTKRWWCRIVGHEWGPWIQITLLRDLRSSTCLRCGSHASINDKGWYAEFYKQERVRAGYRRTAMKDRNN